MKRDQILDLVHEALKLLEQLAIKETPPPEIIQAINFLRAIE